MLAANLERGAGANPEKLSEGGKKESCSFHWVLCCHLYSCHSVTPANTNSLFAYSSLGWFPVNCNNCTANSWQAWHQLFWLKCRALSTLPYCLWMWCLCPRFKNTHPSKTSPICLLLFFIAYYTIFRNSKLSCGMYSLMNQYTYYTFGHDNPYILKMTVWVRERHANLKIFC